MFSWFPSAQNNYEKILFDLENKIKTQENALAQVHAQESFYHNSINSLFKIYLVWMMAIILYSSFYKVEKFAVIIAIVVALLLQGTKKTCEFFYSIQKKRLESKLEKTRLYQLEKIEELKNKTAYYTTKGLIERYETPLKRNESMSDLNTRINGQNCNTDPSISPTNLVEEPHTTPPISGPIFNVKEHALDLGNNSSMGVSMSPSRSWIDRLMDKIVGEPEFSKYALICEFCTSHNGLVPPEIFSRQNFKCFRCDKFNLSQEAKLKNLSMKYMEKESPLRSFNSSNSHNLSELSNGPIGKKESENKDEGKENESREINGTKQRELIKENGTVTPPNGGSDVERKKSSSKLKKRTKR